MDIDAKLRPLYLLQILQERTDEDNYLTTAQLASILKQRYGMEPHRTTIKGDIEVLQQAGFGIEKKAMPSSKRSPLWRASIRLGI